MADNAVPITAAVLTWAREEACLSQAELAQRASLDLDLIQSWETARTCPTKGQFSKLLDILKRPSALFFLAEPPRDSGMPTTLRSAPALGEHKLGPEEARQIRWARRLQELTSWVLRDAGSPKAELNRYQTNEAPFDIAEIERSQSGIAAEEQRSWSSAAAAFRSWRSHLEDQSILVMQLSMGTKNIRGFGVWDDYAPLVAVNTAYHPTARIFTLFHEVGHLLTRSDAACQSFVVPGGQDGTVERWCEQFAAAFLLPIKELVEVASRYGVTVATRTSDPDKARLIASKFSVSACAAAIRLQEAGLAERTLYSAVASQLANRDWNESSGGGGRGPSSAERRMIQFGNRLPDTLLTAANRGRITTRDAADHLQLTTGQLKDLQGLVDARG